jgi:hypothetical protein
MINGKRGLKKLAAAKGVQPAARQFPESQQERAKNSMSA